MPTIAGLGIGVYAEANTSNPIRTPLAVGDIFWVRVAIEGQREADGDPLLGFTAVTLKLSWDPQVLEPVSILNVGQIDASSLLLSPQFSAVRTVRSIDLDMGHGTGTPARQIPSTPNLELGGRTDGVAALGDGSSPTGVDDFLFGWLSFKAIAIASDTPFTIEAGPISSEGAALLKGVNTLSDMRLQKRDNADGTSNAPATALRSMPAVAPSAVVEFLDVVAARERSEVSGVVFTDVNRNGRFDPSFEFGLAGVAMTLRGSGQQDRTVNTDVEGRFQFDDVAAGEYEIVQTQPSGFVDASLFLGSVSPAGSGSPGVADGLNRVRGIRVADGSSATGYEFGENVIPNKRFFLASARPEQELARLTSVVVAMVTAAPPNMALPMLATQQPAPVESSAAIVAAASLPVDPAVEDAQLKVAFASVGLLVVAPEPEAALTTEPFAQLSAISAPQALASTTPHAARDAAFAGLALAIAKPSARSYGAPAVGGVEPLPLATGGLLAESAPLPREASTGAAKVENPAVNSEHPLGPAKFEWLSTISLARSSTTLDASFAAIAVANAEDRPAVLRRVSTEQSTDVPASAPPEPRRDFAPTDDETQFAESWGLRGREIGQEF